MALTVASIILLSTFQSSQAIVNPTVEPTPTSATTPSSTHNVYMPTVRTYHYNPFGVQPDRGRFADPTIVRKATELGVAWARLDVAFWTELQPTRDSPYNVAALKRFENDLDGALQAGLTPIVVMILSPEWATINVPHQTACGAIREDRFADFAAVMAWLADRYKNKVMYWEIGNEPDIDPTLVPPNQVFGCWGDVNDPYYGGEHYGKMLQVVAPAIRKANPHAKIITGGLALDNPNTTAPGKGRPEMFFEGILRSGAANSFDIVAFHSYPWFSNRPLDYDYDADFAGPWKSRGGYTLGKVRFLREVMQKYNVEKPIFLNETAMTCTPPPTGTCPGVNQDFYDTQANFLIRMLSRGWAEGIEHFSWFTLDWPGFRQGSLLNQDNTPRPTYTAYQTFIKHTLPSSAPVRVYAYDRDDASVETYRFTKSNEVVDVLWGKDLSVYYVLTPPGFIGAYDQQGNPITPIGPYIPVGFSAIYIHHKP